MIDKRELMELAETLALRSNVVEKDYVLSWLLCGIYHDPALAGAWVFKGGTCLKKCYFETYRFSEDLDFTITEESHFNEGFLKDRFAAISAWLMDQTGIELPVDLMRFDIYSNERGKPQGQGKIAYRGPMASRGDPPRIKLDLTFDEKLVLPPAQRPVSHPYSDMPDDGMEARCYGYEEVFGEKVRALGERARPRDLYDVINLFRHEQFTATPAVIRDVLQQKCAHKGIQVPTLQSLDRFKDELAGDWAQMLAHQLPQLPPLDSFWSALPEFFRWLEGEGERIRVTPYRLSEGEVTIRGPAGGLPIPYGASAFMEVIRFAASNRLCVELDYTSESSGRSTRLVEPYSLRETKNDNFILSAFDLRRGQILSFRLDRIHGAQVSNNVFTPRYEIELTPTGLLSAPPVKAGSQESFGLGRNRTGLYGRRSTTRTGPTYVYRCPYCNKTFERTKMDGKLNPHKDKSGYPCGGRHGVYETTRY